MLVGVDRQQLACCLSHAFEVAAHKLVAAINLE